MSDMSEIFKLLAGGSGGGGVVGTPDQPFNPAARLGANAGATGASGIGKGGAIGAQGSADPAQRKGFQVTNFNDDGTTTDTAVGAGPQTGAAAMAPKFITAIAKAIMPSAAGLIDSSGSGPQRKGFKVTNFNDDGSTNSRNIGAGPSSGKGGSIGS